MSGMGFHDLIKQLQESAPEEISESVWADLTQEYDALESGSVAKVTELTTEKDALAAENQRLKSVNYDLLTASGAPNGGDDSNNNNDADDNDSPLTIGSLFEFGE